MSRELHEDLGDALLDVLQGGWAKYLDLEAGDQVSLTWHQEGELRWLQVTNVETGHAANFRVAVDVQPYELPPIGPEDDGALRAELADHGPEEDRTWGEVLDGDLCLGEDGTWYEVTASAPGTGPNKGRQMVTLLISGEPKGFPFFPEHPVRVQRGLAGQAFDNLAAAGLGPEVL